MIFAYVLLPSAVMPTQIMAWHGHVLPLGPCQLKAADWLVPSSFAARDKECMVVKSRSLGVIGNRSHTKLTNWWVDAWFRAVPRRSDTTWDTFGTAQSWTFQRNWRELPMLKR